jgi:hypothetical protein
MYFSNNIKILSNYNCIYCWPIKMYTSKQRFDCLQKKRIYFEWCQQPALAPHSAGEKGR